MKTAWGWVCCASRSETGHEPEISDWKILLMGVRSCDLGGFLEDQIQSLPDTASAAIQIALQHDFRPPNDPDHEQEVHPLELNFEYMDAFGRLCSKMEQSMARMNLQTNIFRNLQEHPVNPVGISVWPGPGKDEWERKLYEEQTLVPTSQGPQLSDASSRSVASNSRNPGPAYSNTGLPFDELRYLNWRDINNLLIQAELHEARTRISVDEAVLQGRSVSRAKSSQIGPGQAEQQRIDERNQLAAHRLDAKNEAFKGMTEEGWRSKILRLRDPKS